MKNVVLYVRFFLPAIIWAAVIFSFSAQQVGSTSQVYWQDFVVKKAAHMFVYAVLAVLSFRALYNVGVSRNKSLVWALVFCVFYGFTDEYHQSFVPGREAAVRDVIFDTIGATAAVFTLWKLLPKAPKKLMKLAENLHLH